MADEIGSVKGITGSSVAHNNQAGCGGQKPSNKGSDNPGGHKPPRIEDGKVPMPK